MRKRAIMTRTPLLLALAAAAALAGCNKDNSVIYVDWLSDGSARVRKDRNEVGTSVQVGDAGPIKGTPEASAISYNGQSCKA